MVKPLLTVVLVIRMSLCTAQVCDASSTDERCTAGREDLYGLLDVPKTAGKEVITKAYRKLARKWHPDKNRDNPAEAEAAFAKIAYSYKVLTDPEKREIFDRLGEPGLQRLRDGDPSVKKGWVPPDEVLRRLHNDGVQNPLDALVTGSVAVMGKWTMALSQAGRRLYVWLGLWSLNPSVHITASDSSGNTVYSDGHAATGVTFKFALSKRTEDFRRDHITHSNCVNPKFMGMKDTYYLTCSHSKGLVISVHVAENKFSDMRTGEPNTASSKFVVVMT